MNDNLHTTASASIGVIFQRLLNDLPQADLAAAYAAGNLAYADPFIDVAYASVAEVALTLYLTHLNEYAHQISRLLVADTSRWRVVEEQARVRSMLVTILAHDQKQVVRQIQQTHDSPAVVAFRVRNALGLTWPQAQAILAYERVLMQPTRQEVEEDNLVSAGQMVTMTGVKARGARQVRIAALALVESQRARGRAELEAWTQAVDGGLISAGSVVREWRVRGHNTRDSHGVMAGQRRALREPFVSGRGNTLMYPCDASAPAEDVANCQCSVAYVRV